MENSELLERQTLFLLKKLNKAIRDYRLIDNGDRIAVAVSGCKDSLVLLRLLLAQRAIQQQDVDYIVVHITIDDAPGSPERAAALQAHCQEVGVEFVTEPLPMNEGESWPLSCQRCAWNRRKALFLTANRLGCNKVAMGHHADDVAETVLMNLIHHGRVEAIPPKRTFFKGKITLIRPLVLISEREIALFARRAGYPIGSVVCAHTRHSERSYAADLLQQIEKKAPWVKANLRRAAETQARLPEKQL